MRTNMLLASIGTNGRMKIVSTLFEFPNRQWSCSSLEDLTRQSHATIFRVLKILARFGVLRSIKINRKDIIYELVSKSPYTRELKRSINIDKIAANELAMQLAKQIKSKNIKAVILYGSSITGAARPESDIDVLAILKKYDAQEGKKILDVSASISTDACRTISVTIISENEAVREAKKAFLTSVISNMEVIYGKAPF